jgi:hypothetical protein
MSKLEDSLKETEANTLKYMIANIEGKNIFLHEAVWVLNSQKPIPSGKLVSHKDGDTMNNNFDNLELVDENVEYGDLHQRSNKIFHDDYYMNHKEFIKKHFDDIYMVIF